MSAPPTPPADAIAAEILRQAEARGRDGSISPMDVARALVPDDTWRRLLGPVHAAAGRLQRDGRIEILRKGKPVPPEAVRGVIRLRIAGG
jgi:hypothetical protein